MQVIPAESNWQLTIRRTADSVTILRAATCDRCAVLPDILLGLPVTELGDRALAPGAAEVPGEQLLLTCGPASFEPDNRKLEKLTLPAELRSVGNYGFFNCRELKTLHLHDRTERWGSGCLMNCRSLDTFVLTRDTEEQGEALAFFAAALSRQLDVTILQNGQRTRLIFPEYLELYEENSAAHHFDLNISGAGYPYHSVFRSRNLSLSDYDTLWERFLTMEHRPEAALLLAWYRLRYPTELSEPAEQAYLAYVLQHAEAALSLTLKQKDLPGLQRLLTHETIPREAIAEALALARYTGFTEASAILLEAQHKLFPSVRNRSFDL